MILVSQEITDLKTEFEGGKSLSVDWYAILRRAQNKVLGMIYPDTLTRKVPVYGGLSRDLHIYYCPTDVLVPSFLYPNSENMGGRKFVYRAAKAFLEKNEENTFTIVYINKIRFLLVRHAESPSVLTLNDMDDVSEIGGTASSLIQNTFNFISGTGAVQASFDDSGKYISGTLATAEDITAYKFGIALAPLNWLDSAKIASVKLQLLTSVGNYFEVLSTADSIGDSFVNGLNMVRFELANRTSTGSPDLTSIASWKLIITMTTGQTQTVIIDKLTLQKSAHHNFEYISSSMFVDGTTGAFKSTPVSGDYINLDRDAMGCLHYEACLIVGKPSISGINFGNELAREYQNYWANHPSTAQPISYNIAPDIALGEPADLPLTIGESRPHGTDEIDYGT